ncbi:MAG: hypothetical protein M3O28_08585 [Actinomycetota bacterium]|nr:hypothetical protein [Actinomycetota bacterium]
MGTPPASPEGGPYGPGPSAEGFGASADALGDLAPVLRRAVNLDPRSLARLRLSPGDPPAGRDAEGAGPTACVLVRLPFGVLVSRTIELPGGPVDNVDVAIHAGEFLAWLDGEQRDPPVQRNGQWRTGLPPSRGWQRVDTVPDAVVRDLVRAGALTVKQAAAGEGVPHAEPRAQVTDVLLDAVVLTVHDEDRSAQVTLRVLSAVLRMGFMPSGSHIAVDLAGRWTRVAARYGSVYAERAGRQLNLL